MMFTATNSESIALRNKFKKYAILFGVLFFSSLNSAAQQEYILLDADAAELAQQKYSQHVQVIRQHDENMILKIDSSIREELAHELHEEFKSCGSFMSLNSEQEAMSLIQSFETQLYQSISLADYQINRQSTVNGMFPQVSASKVKNLIEKLSAFHTRAAMTSHGRDSVEWLMKHWRQITKQRSDIIVQKIEHSWRQPSLMAMIRGSENPERYIVIGGHVDSLNYTSSVDHAPGADDNASGTAAVSEILRVLSHMSYSPKNTIVFFAYSFEEGGLHGSQDIAQIFSERNKEVLGVLQLDMILHNNQNSQPIYFITNDTHHGQNQFLMNLMQSYQLGSYATGPLSGGTSDHRSWTLRGYPASFPFESNQPFQQLHTVNDTLPQAFTGDDLITRFVKLGLAFAVELDQ